MSAAVILAAGAGRRLGGVAKALLRGPGGDTFLAAVSSAARAGGVTRMVVVIGPPHDAVTRTEAQRLGLDTVDNPRPDRGMASSVAVGFGYARRRFSDLPGALLWPVDHPRVRPQTVRAILARLTPAGVIIPTYQDRGGHPSGFGRDLWQDLESCVSAPEGARSVIRKLAQTRGEVAGADGTDARDRYVDRFPVTDAGVLADVDVPEQLETHPRG